jgi:predicted permease
MMRPQRTEPSEQENRSYQKPTDLTPPADVCTVSLNAVHLFSHSKATLNGGVRLWRSGIIHLSLGLLLSIFANDIAPIFAIAAIGFLLARHFDASVATVSKISFNALSPCLVFDQLVMSNITGSEFGRMALFCLLLTGAMGLAARLAAIPLRIDRQTLSSFLLVVMFSNSGNYALPVVLFAFGRDALSYASVYFVTSAILVYTVGVFVAASGGRSVRRALRGIVRVPAIYAVVAAGTIMLTRIQLPLAVMRPIGMLSDAALPVMLLVMGMQLERAVMPKHPAAVATAVSLSLVVGPLVGIGLSGVLGLSGPARQAAILLASMPAAVVTTVLALEFDLDPSFATSAVFVSTLLSPFSIVLIIAYLQTF